MFKRHADRTACFLSEKKATLSRYPHVLQILMQLVVPSASTQAVRKFKDILGCTRVKMSYTTSW